MKLFLIALGLSVFGCAHQTQLGQYLETGQLTGLPAPYAALVLSQKDSFPQGHEFREFVTAEGNGISAQVEVLQSEKTAELEWKQKAVLMDTIYEGVIDPYFTSLTKRSSCPKEFGLLEKKTGRGDLRLYSAFANSNKGIGSCVKADIAYDVQVVDLYCPQARQIISLKIFRALGEFPNYEARLAGLQSLASVSCR